MFVTVNGEKRELPREATIQTVVELLANGGRSQEVAARGIAVAVEGEVVPRDDWSSTPLQDGERVEVLAAIQGGAA